MLQEQALVGLRVDDLIKVETGDLQCLLDLGLISWRCQASPWLSTIYAVRRRSSAAAADTRAHHRGPEPGGAAQLRLSKFQPSVCSVTLWHAQVLAKAAGQLAATESAIAANKELYRTLRARLTNWQAQQAQTQQEQSAATGKDMHIYRLSDISVHVHAPKSLHGCLQDTCSSASAMSKTSPQNMSLSWCCGLPRFGVCNARGGWPFLQSEACQGTPLAF